MSSIGISQTVNDTKSVKLPKNYEKISRYYQKTENFDFIFASIFSERSLLDMCNGSTLALLGSRMKNVVSNRAKNYKFIVPEISMVDIVTVTILYI